MSTLVSQSCEQQPICKLPVKSHCSSSWLSERRKGWSFRFRVTSTLSFFHYSCLLQTVVDVIISNVKGEVVVWVTTISSRHCCILLCCSFCETTIHGGIYLRVVSVPYECVTVNPVLLHCLDSYTLFPGECYYTPCSICRIHYGDCNKQIEHQHSRQLHFPSLLLIIQATHNVAMYREMGVYQICG